MKIYVLTEESFNNALIGVFTTPMGAFNAMLRYVKDSIVIGVKSEPIGTRYIFNSYDEEENAIKEIVMYIEITTLDDDLLHN